MIMVILILFDFIALGRLLEDSSKLKQKVKTNAHEPEVYFSCNHLLVIIILGGKEILTRLLIIFHYDARNEAKAYSKVKR